MTIFFFLRSGWLYFVSLTHSGPAEGFLFIRPLHELLNCHSIFHVQVSSKILPTLVSRSWYQITLKYHPHTDTHELLNCHSIFHVQVLSKICWLSANFLPTLVSQSWFQITLNTIPILIHMNLWIVIVFSMYKYHQKSDGFLLTFCRL